MTESRTTNSVRNIVSGTINRIIALVFPFIARTAIVYVLGKEYLGLGSLFTSILKVLNLSELGFGSALVFSMYKPIAEGDTDSICALLKMYRKIYRIIGIIIVIVGLGVLPFLPLLIKGEIPSDINVYILYSIYLINTAVSYFAFAYKRALLTAYQKSSVYLNVQSVFVVLSYATQLSLLFIFRNFYVYIVILPFLTITENVVTAYFSKKYYPNIECRGEVSPETKKQIKNHVKGIALQKICSTSRNTFDSIAISMFLGLVAIGIYNNYFYILTSVHAFLYLIPNAIRASVGNSVAKESLEKNYGDFKKLNFLYMWLACFCATCLFCLYQHFMKIWMGEDMLLPTHTMVLFVVYFFELCLSDIIALYKDAAGLWWHGRYRTIIEAIANLLLNFLFGWFWGIDGILLASILTLLFIGLGYGGYIIFHHYFSKYSFFKNVVNVLFFAFIAATICLGTYIVCSLLPTGGILALFGKAVICALLPNILLFLITFKTEIFKHAIEFARNIIKNKKGKKI